MKIEELLYAVVLWNKDVPEKAFLGYSATGGPQLFRKRKDAVAYKKACIAAKLKNARVVLVNATMEFEFQAQTEAREKL